MWYKLGLALLAMAGLLTVPAGQDALPTTSGQCEAAWCKAGASTAAAQRLVDEQLATLVAGRDCWVAGTRDAIPETVLVKGVVTNKSVVWSMTLDAAFAANEDGDSWNDVIVLRGCDAG